MNPKHVRTAPNRSLVAFLMMSAMLSLAAVALRAQDDPILTVNRIFGSAEFKSAGFGGFSWLSEGDTYVRPEPSTTVKDGYDLVSYRIDTNERKVLIPAEKIVPKGQTAQIDVEGLDFSADNSKVLIYTNSVKVWRLNTKGDYWVLDRNSGEFKKIGGDAEPSTLMFAKFSPDGTKVGYVHENDLYVQDIASGKITRLTNDGSHTLINGTSDWVNEEEFSLRDCWRWSPDSRSIAFWQFDASGIEDFLLLNNTVGLYPKLTKIPYPKTGTQNSAVRVGVIPASGGKIRWIETPGDPRNNYIVSVDWTGDSKHIYLQHMNRLQNTLQLLNADPTTGKSTAVLTERDDAWVDNDISELTWLDGGSRFLWISERDGWRKVYSVSADGKDIRPVTKGDADMISIAAIDTASGWLYYIASPDNPTQRYLYRTKLDGSGMAERMTPAGDNGWNNYSLSPNAHWAVQSTSSFGVPSRIVLLDLQKKTVAKNILDNAELRGKLDKLARGPQEFFRVDVGDGVSLDAWMMKPPNFDPSKKYPVLMYAYSEPAGQTVMDLWTGSQYLWFLSLTQQGYIVASVDNRGTPSPRGRAFRKSIYKKLGVLNSGDQAAAVRAMLAKMPYLDADRVGIWGWSGGGVATLNAMFRYPDLYKVGLAVAPMADNRYYDTIYTERYLGLPKDDPDVYERAAPLTYAKGLKGDLLIVHGTGDDNVHYQATELLFNALIAENKPFTMMAYPNRTHGIFEGKGTTLHLYGLLTRYLNEHLAAGPR